jgi:hypothetical protein
VPEFEDKASENDGYVLGDRFVGSVVLSVVPDRKSKKLVDKCRMVLNLSFSAVIIVSVMVEVSRDVLLFLCLKPYLVECLPS